ncbi:MAG TPA: response regulator [Polyangiaceae bacterium]|jgi:CheY-like chemotaxis protein
MIDERGVIDGDLDVQRNTRLYGRVSGSVTVKCGRTFILHGTIGRSLILEDAAVAHVYGTVLGDVVNGGHSLCVWKSGTIRGTLHRRNVNKVEGGATVRAMLRPTSDSTPPEAALEGFRVLLAEDDDDTRDEVEALLRSCGAETTSTRSGAQAYEAFVHEPPDVILTDLWMPTGGYDFVKRVRKLAFEDGGLTPAIAMTACTFDTAEKALLEGFHAHLPKPFDPNALVDLVTAFRDASFPKEGADRLPRWKLAKRGDGAVLVTLRDQVRVIDVHHCIAALRPYLEKGHVHLMIDARRVTGLDVALGSVIERALWTDRGNLEQVLLVGAAPSVRLVLVAACLALAVPYGSSEELPPDLPGSC